jgi:hypothetical protein
VGDLPEGRPVNIGEVLVGDNHRSKLYVTTDLQSFAMIVTAEPYYAVRRPSNLVVLENVVRPDTRGSTESVTAKYELIDRGGYLPTGYKFDPVVLIPTASGLNRSTNNFPSSAPKACGVF